MGKVITQELAMKPVDVPLLVRQTCSDLQALEETIGQNVSNVNAESLERLLKTLKKEANDLARASSIGEVHEIDPKLRADLEARIRRIRHTGTLSQAIGPYQEKLFPIFERFELAIRKFESKVTRVDNDPLSR